MQVLASFGSRRATHPTGPRSHPWDPTLVQAARSLLATLLSYNGLLREARKAADAIAVNGGVYDCLRLAGGIVRRFRRQLLRKPSHVRG